MSNLKNWFNIITNNEIHAYNRVTSRDLSLCINFLQIPDTDVIVMTITIMKNKMKKNALDPTNFAKIMGCIERSLVDTYCENPSKYSTDTELFNNPKNSMSSDWYIQLCCHRIFFIPENSLFDTIQHIFNQENVRLIKSNGVISEISVFVNTDSYDFNAKFY